MSRSFRESDFRELAANRALPPSGQVAPDVGTVQSGDTSPLQVFAIVCVGIVLANLDLFSVNIALHKIAAEFKGASLEDLSWILNAYAIAYAALLVFFGRLAEGYRRDRGFIVGIGIFTAAAVACAVSSSVWELVIYRLAAAAGAALMTPASLGLLLACYPAEGRGTAVRNWAGIGGFAAALGPLVGGVLVSMNWRLIFAVNAAIGMVAIGIAWRKLPAVPGHAVERPSVLAALSITGGIACLILAIVKGNSWGWRSWEVASCLAISAVLLGTFVAHCLRSLNPLVDPALVRIRPFTGAALAMFPYSMTFGAMLFSIAVWCQSAWGWSALQTGLAIIPGPLLVPTTSLIFTSGLLERFGTARVVAAGIVCVVVGFCVWAARMGTEPSVGLVVVGMVLNGVGVGLIFPTLMGVSTHALPPSSFATGSGSINMIRQAAIAIGVAIFVAIIGAPTSSQERLDSFRIGWWVMAAITALALIPTFLMLRPRGSSENGQRS